MKEKIKSILLSILALLAGGVLFAMAMNMFLLPAGIVQGGVTGIASALNIRFGIPVGLMMVAINIPLLLLNIRVNGWRFIGLTAAGVLITSIASEFLNFFPVTMLDPFLCSVIGGALMGVAIGLIFSGGFTTGGTDLIVFLIRRKWKRIPIGKLVLIIDVIIIGASAILLKNFMGIFYSAITIYVQSLTLDRFLTGTERTRLFLVITDNPDDVAAALSNLGRGVTLLDGKGYFTGKEKGVVMCAVTPREVFNAQNAVSSADPRAFSVIADCSQTVGEGFNRKIVSESSVFRFQFSEVFHDGKGRQCSRVNASTADTDLSLQDDNKNHLFRVICGKGDFVLL